MLFPIVFTALIFLFAPLVSAQEATSSALVSDQSQTIGNTKEDFDNGDGQWLAQTFTASSSGQLAQVTLSLDRNDSPNTNGEVTLELRGTLDATPSASIIASTSTPSATLNKNGQQDVNFTFNTTPTINPGTSYALVLYRSGLGTITTNYNWYRAVETGNQYPFGAGFTSLDFGITWILRNNGKGDHIFTTYLKNLPLASPSPTPAITNTTSSPTNPLTQVSPKSCSDTKPGTPTLLSARVLGENRVILTWSKAQGATYYLITYGTSPNAQQYGNPNVGGENTTSFIVDGLSGGFTYYFKARAGNGCAPGDFSNELSATPKGLIFQSVAVGFSPGILGEATNSGEIIKELTPSLNQLPQPSITTDNSSTLNVFDFILNLIKSLLTSFF